MPKRKRLKKAEFEEDMEPVIVEGVSPLSKFIATETKEVTPEPNAPPHYMGDDVDEYLRRQIYQELYGTEEPTNYDRLQLSLKERAQRYGR